MKNFLSGLLLVLVAIGIVKWLTAPTPIAAAPDPVVSRAPTHVMAFTASWCTPCHRDRPKREELARHVSLTIVDVDNDPSGAAEQFGVTRLPTYIVFANGSDGYGLRLQTTNIDEVFRYLSL